MSEMPSWINKRPSISELEGTVEQMLSGSGRIKCYLSGFMEMGMQWEPLPLFACPVVKEQRDDEGALRGYELSAHAYEDDFFCDDLEISFSGDKRADLISLLKELYLFEEFPEEGEISEEIYDVLDDLGAAGIPENGYSLREISDLAQRLNKLLKPTPKPQKDPFHPEIREAISVFSEARNHSDLYIAMKELGFLLQEDYFGRLK